jgi:hypothetical protein
MISSEPSGFDGGAGSLPLQGRFGILVMESQGLSEKPVKVDHECKVFSSAERRRVFEEGLNSFEMTLNNLGRL